MIGGDSQRYNYVATFHPHYDPPILITGVGTCTCSDHLSSLPAQDLCGVAYYWHHLVPTTLVAPGMARTTYSRRISAIATPLGAGAVGRPTCGATAANKEDGGLARIAAPLATIGDAPQPLRLPSCESPFSAPGRHVTRVSLIQLCLSNVIITKLKIIVLV